MQEMKLSRTDLAKQSGIHLSEISRILNHKQSLSVCNLDVITLSLGLTEGALYSYFAEECFNVSRYLDKRKSEQFLYKCAVMGFKEQLHSILDAVLEERSKTIRNKNFVHIFAVAEQLFEEGKEEKALSLYEFIIENMPDHFSQEVAISYVRRFYIVRLTEEGQYALGHVLEHIAYMPEEFQELSYMLITATFFIREEWKKTLYYARKLEKIAKEGEHYGRALVYQSLALQRLGNSLEEVLALIDRYEQVNDYYAGAAVGNRFCVFLDFGQFEYVDEYLNWLESRDDMFAGLPRVLEAYVHLHRLEDVERLIYRFQDVIQDWAASIHPYQQQLYLRFRYAYALYHFASKRFSEGLYEVLDVAYAANQIGNRERFKQCILIYWEYREYVTVEHEAMYVKLFQTENMIKQHLK
ncbi:helix-turn-helix transcriptional regulator [Paenisporosarcina sp. FSL H8-0542]|uniref:helix-turn-helix domain-containing protein n=1 Tax=Paenisporosarcina sp. FSL H8-0542 TaxID=2921401 RepID=UPI00315A4E5E